MKTNYFSKLASPGLRNLRPYEAKEIPCKVKLDANESPYPPLISLEKSVLRKLNRYPDPEARDLKKTISKKLKVIPVNILLGNGSDELIYYLIIAFGGPVLFPVPTFSMYGIIAEALGQNPIGIPLDDNFDLDTDRMLSEIKRSQPKLVFLSSPNNPTGNCFSTDRILKIVEASKGIVIVDEAYQPFASKKGFLPLLKDYRNLAILRTLSKVGLASLRLGFLIADPALIMEVNKVRLPFNINMLSQTVALKAFRKTDIMDSRIDNIISEREKLFNRLSCLEGVVPYPSEANFIFFRVDNSDKVFQELLAGGILVRNLGSTVENCLRVTVGTPAENKAFIQALKTAVKMTNRISARRK